MSIPPAPVGRLSSLHRYPVKSLAGQSVDAVDVGTRGLAGDRAWAVRDPDGKLGSGKSSRRFRKMDGLLLLSGAFDGEVPVVAFPDGRRVRADDPAVHDALSGYVGRPVRLEPEGEVSHFDDGPVHLVTTSGLRAVTEAHGGPVDVRHFRPNLVLDTGDAPGYPEDDWIGRRLVIGDVELEVVAPMPRCVMVTMEQVDLPGDRDLLTTVADTHPGDTATGGSGAGDFGVLAEVRRPGRLTLNNLVHLI
ncbi:MAG: MOSC domain-containing protein [Acidimicrobiia bacterium]